MRIDITLPDETWLPLKNFENILDDTYYISNYGRVYSLLKNRIIESARHSNGYRHITLKNKDGKYNKVLVHRLVAFTYMPNPENKKEVNHIDGLKFNNYYKNLEWVTPSENIIHSYETGLNKGNQPRPQMRGKNSPAYKYDDEMIHFICKCLSLNMKPKKITEVFITKYPDFKYKSVYKYIKTKIKNRMYRTDISSQYNF